MRYVFCCNTLHGFCNFRLDVVKHLIEMGNEATIVYPYIDGDEATLKLLPQGCRAMVCRMSPNGKTIWRDLTYMVGLYRIMKQIRPAVVFNYTVKPNIYGGLAARMLGIPTVAVVPGLGYAFTKRGLFGKLIRIIYVRALQLAKEVLVLNSSDRAQLVTYGIKENKLTLLEGGEGVNLERFAYRDGLFQKPRFLMIARLLYDKGYREFVSAASRVKEKYPNARFDIAGTLNETNPDGVPLSIVENDIYSGAINYLGYVEDIAKEIADPNTVVVIPSYYREGLNRSLMEACSCGRPVITTNLPGLKEMADDGENGFLVEPRNVDSLFEAISQFMELPVEKRILMGLKSREIAEKRFDVKQVYEIYDMIINKITRSNV